LQKNNVSSNISSKIIVNSSSKNSIIVKIKIIIGRRGSAALTTRHTSICKKSALTSPTSDVAIVRSRTKATDLLLLLKLVLVLSL
jgi:hypothetical protein